MSVTTDRLCRVQAVASYHVFGTQLTSGEMSSRVDIGATGGRGKGDRGYISDLENDKLSPTVAMLFQLCDALAVPASEVLARIKATRTLAADQG